MRLWTEFFPDLMQDVLGCPEPTVEQYLRRAAQEFCQRTLCWREDLTITTRASTSEYALPLAAGGQVVKLLGASLNGNDIDLEAADGTSTADRINGTRGSKRVRLLDPFNVLLQPTQAAGLALVLEVILKPSETSTGLPDQIADGNRLAIADGALSRLLNINRAEWRNPSLADDKKAEFEKAIGKAQTAAWKAYSRARPRVTGQYF
jgi:hypothetical protein